jgi:hypothetical protein
MAARSLERGAIAVFSLELVLSIGAVALVALHPSVLGGVSVLLFGGCALLGLCAAHSAYDEFALLRVGCALALSVVLMFFVMPRAEALANQALDTYVIPRLALDLDAETVRELRRTLHFGEDALLCLVTAMVCAGWVLFSTVYWAHIRRARLAERAIRRFLKATPAIPYLAEPLLQQRQALCARAGRGSAPPPPSDTAPALDGTAPLLAAAASNLSTAEAAPGVARVDAAADGSGSDSEAECCAICLSPFEPGEAVRVLICTHPFHQGCIDKWVVAMRLAADCPLCKRGLMESYL